MFVRILCLFAIIATAFAKSGDSKVSRSLSWLKGNGVEELIGRDLWPAIWVLVVDFLAKFTIIYSDFTLIYIISDYIFKKWSVMIAYVVVVVAFSFRYFYRFFW